MVYVIEYVGENGVNSVIYAYDFTSGEVKEIAQAELIGGFGVSGDEVVWEGSTNSVSNVYHYNLNTGVTSILLNNTSAPYLEFKDHVVVWRGQFWEDNDSDLLVLDLNTNKLQRIGNLNQYEELIAIDGSQIVYFEGFTETLYIYDLVTGKTTSTPISGLRFNGSKILVGHYLAFNNTYTTSVDIFDISSNTVVRTIADGEVYQFDGKTLIYRHYKNYQNQYENRGMFAYDFETQSTLKLIDGEPDNSESHVTLDGEHVIWSSLNSVYYYNLKVKSLVKVADAAVDNWIGAGVFLRKPYIYWGENLRETGDGNLLSAKCSENVSNTPTLTPTNIPLTATLTPSTATGVPATDTPPHTTIAPSETGTVTPSTTLQPTISTPTPTTEITSTLLTNSGFENGQTGWTVKRGVGDKVKCNRDGKPPVAKSGTCAFQFKGSAGERSSVEQTLAAQTWAVGDTLNLSAWVKATNSAANGKIKVRVKYSDGTATGKIDADIRSNSDYTELTGSYALLSANVSKVKLAIQNRSAAGKVWVDDVELLKGSGSLLALP